MLLILLKCKVDKYDPKFRAFKFERLLKSFSWHITVYNSFSPAYPTLLTVILLLIFVKQVANVTIIFPKVHMTLLTSLLCLTKKTKKLILSKRFGDNQKILVAVVFFFTSPAELLDTHSTAPPSL